MFQDRFGPQARRFHSYPLRLPSGLRRGLAPLPRFCLPSGRWADWVQRAVQGRFRWTRAGLGQSKREADL